MSQYDAQPLERLINNFSRLSGVGRKGATRMAYQILSMDKKDAEEFRKVRDQIIASFADLDNVLFTQAKQAWKK